MRKYFGTDGLRGTANLSPMTPELISRLGEAAVHLLANGEKTPRLLIGRDTRRSGDMIEAALASGAAARGAEVFIAGIIPTPGVAYLTRHLQVDLGAVISASHNIFSDNGVKLFSHSGFKFPDAWEENLEELLENGELLPRPTGPQIGTIRPLEDAETPYLNHLKDTFGAGRTLKGLKICLDAAHGAVGRVAPRLFEELGAQVSLCNASPDGTNINDHCGSLFPDFIQSRVLIEGADLGFTFDGDGDRVITVDHQGEIWDGDCLLALCARFLAERGELPGKKVVATVMSNMGFEVYLQSLGIELLRTQVGDRYVLEEMQRTGALLGGEQSGHMIFLNHTTTGDGLVTALQLLKVLAETGRSLTDLRIPMERYPQVLVNVPTSRGRDPEQIPSLQKAIQWARHTLGKQGRVLVRPSGTEPMIRIMVEGQEQDLINRLAQELAQCVRDTQSPEDLEKEAS
ncbi:MAG: phosphoglucosamine mutase [Candidatus Tectomicrobia bacterium]|uniref:Phosphoglucosamine mutase n=1 Tax=Tectimicrobiota bacterium TaxID=2528274 RepID=A0A932GR30_UNCTE|nr:phosphoglucosamine mutase [Candidatus Tectomicrobia bacterium]